MQRQSRRLLILLIMLITAGIRVLPVFAHANLSESSPQANAVLDSAPPEIRLWFTEPLEPAYSRIQLIDSTGAVIELPPSQVDPNDPYQMFIVTDTLTEGIYTVSWRVVSAADGHPTIGSFPITIGAVVGGTTTAAEITESIPVTDSAVRWINLLSLTLTVGSIGFWKFVWSPSVKERDPRIEHRMAVLIWIGWIALGISGALLLMMQAALTLGIPITEVIGNSGINAFVSSSRFGELWLIRIAVWLGLGGVLYFALVDRWFLWVALFMGIAMLLITSLYSHASAAPTDTIAAILADWLHLGGTALWVGGLIQFVNVIIALQRRPAEINRTETLRALVGYFSNFARVAVISLFVTGFYAAWLHVHTVDALLSTLYGNLLLLKLGLFFPCLIIAAINLFFTNRGLAAGKDIWATRLRGLVGTEIVLTVSVLAIVGAMTSIAPAKVIADARAVQAAQQVPPNPYTQTLVTDNITAVLNVEPGYVGANTFTITLTDENGAPVENATRIRFTFRNLSGSDTQSELRFEHQGGGVYLTQGANIGSPGDWRMRAIVAIPQQFDRTYDFEHTFDAAPAPPPAPQLDPYAPLPNRTPILLVIGLFALGIGGFFLGESRMQIGRGAGFIAVGLVVVGIVFLISGLSTIPV